MRDFDTHYESDIDWAIRTGHARKCDEHGIIFDVFTECPICFKRKQAALKQPPAPKPDRTALLAQLHELMQHKPIEGG